MASGIFARRHPPERVRQKRPALGFDGVCISVVTLYELTDGAEKHDLPIKARSSASSFSGFSK